MFSADHCSPREEVLCMDRWLHPGLPVHLPADVDQQAGVRWVRPQHCPQEVLLNRLVSPLSKTHTATNPNDWLCIHSCTNTLVCAEPTTLSSSFPLITMAMAPSPLMGRNSAGSSERPMRCECVEHDVHSCVCVCHSRCVCSPPYLPLWRFLLWWGSLPNRPVVLLM